MKNLRVVGQPIYYNPKPEWAEAESKASYRFGTSAVAVRAECTDLLTAINGALQSMDQSFPPRPVLFIRLMLVQKPSGFRQLFSNLWVTNPHTATPYHPDWQLVKPGQ